MCYINSEQVKECIGIFSLIHILCLNPFWSQNWIYNIYNLLYLYYIIFIYLYYL